MLVAAGQIANEHARATRLDSERTEVFIDDAVPLRAGDRAEPSPFRLDSQHNVLGNSEVADDSFRSAVLRRESNLVVNRVPRRTEANLFAANCQCAVIGVIRSVDEASELGAARTKEPG